MVSEGNNFGRWYYACRNPHGRKGHARLLHETVDDFFNSLMSEHSAEVIEVVAAHSDGAGLMAELRELEEAYLVAEAARREEAARIKKEEIEPRVEDMIGRDDPTFEETVARLVSAKCRTLEEQAKEQQEQIALGYAHLKDIRHKEDFEQMKTVTKQWPELTVRRQNGILKDIFVSLEMTGEAPNECLIPTFRVPDSNFAAPITIEAHKRGPSWVRTLEDPDEWLEKTTKVDVVPWQEDF